MGENEWIGESYWIGENDRVGEIDGVGETGSNNLLRSRHASFHVHSKRTRAAKLADCLAILDDG